ncbi:MAG: glycoside hydrolase family 88 protein [Bacteroidales bacterium]|nr:glycoside hydrolase family 88 protein [Bacteroidales bacterium]
MKINLKPIFLAFVAAASLSAVAQELPKSTDVLNAAKKVNAYFMKTTPDVTLPSYVNKMRPSNIWTRGVYYEGLMALYEIYPDAKYYDYAYSWAEFHKWGFRYGNTDRNADDYCCAQTYIDLYRMEPDAAKLRNTKALVQMLVNQPENDDWYWVDAVQMGMPVLAKLGATLGDKAIFEKMWNMYAATRNTIGGGLWCAEYGLWYRDAAFVAPYKEVNGKPCFWSRGNGWAMANYVRILNELPQDDPHRATYIADFTAMAKAIAKCQRKDGFWNASMLCEENFGGMETTGTSLFVYSLAWGIRTGILDSKTYLPVMLKAWNGLMANSIRANGSLAYVQGTGSKPSDGQPATATSTPDFEDYGIGCFLLAASEVYKISAPVSLKK